MAARRGWPLAGFTRRRLAAGGSLAQARRGPQRATPVPQVAQPQDRPMRRTIAARLGRRCIALGGCGIGRGFCGGDLAGRTAVAGRGQMRRAPSATPPAA
jgi:hypothetical protein